MPFEKNRHLTPFSQKLRREMTNEEKYIWYDFLIRFPDEVKRQYVIGNYIVDFVILKKMIVIEIDGRQHLTPEMKKSDAERDAYLESLGFKVLRYSNKSVRENKEGVARNILRHAGYTFDDLKPIKPHKRRTPVSNG